MCAELQAELEKITQEISLIDIAIDELSRKKQVLISKKSQINVQISEKASEELANQDCEQCDYPWSNKVKEVLKSKFNLDKFKPHELSTINAVMSGQDCILLMSPGSGKSLCYQLPAMVLDGITVVVSSSVSLIEDQIMAMEALDFPTAFLNKSTTREHVIYLYKELISKNPFVKFLYLTPEKLTKNKCLKSKLKEMYQMGKFSLLVIDEIHGYSLQDRVSRPGYLSALGVMKQLFPKVPILSLTATTRTLQHFQTILKECLVIKAPFNRPNLKYEVVCKSWRRKNNVSVLVDLIKKRFHGLSGIIYCFSIEECENIAFGLQRQGIKARAYHAQLDAITRISIYNSWTSNSTLVILATEAFGMGIDKPDVRFVIHHSLPESIENFYQECEHAGRDDQPASCILFYCFDEIFRQSTMVYTEQNGLDKLYKMVAYCLDLSRCRRSLIAQHFDKFVDTQDCNKMCDHCEQEGLYEEKWENIAGEYRSIINILKYASSKERLIIRKLIKAWRGKGCSKFLPPGHLATTHSREECERILAFLLLKSYLKEEFHVTPDSTISFINIGQKRLSSDEELLFPLSVEKIKNDGVDSVISPTKNIESLESSSPTSKQQQAEKSSSSPSTATLPSSVKEKNSDKTSTDIVKIKEKLHLQNGVTLKQKPETSSNVNAASVKKRSQNYVLSSDDNIMEGTKRQKIDIKKPEKEMTTDDKSDKDSRKLGDNGVLIKKKKSKKKKKMPMIVIDSD